MLINSDNFNKIKNQKTTYIKNFTDLEIDYDFNFLIEFLEHYTCPVDHGGSYDKTWSAPLQQSHSPFNYILNYFRKTFEYNFNDEDGCRVFYSFASNSGPSHVDREDVFLLGLHGKTIYKVEYNFYEIEKGDLLFVTRGDRHKAISVTPRIVASFGFFGGKNGN
tara:strand:+ start:2063 stop:2554 length:492 start_codon:yes stop_codon:yes gene_type:complete